VVCGPGRSMRSQADFNITQGDEENPMPRIPCRVEVLYSATSCLSNIVQHDR
jgi:hypothetical protein